MRGPSVLLLAFVLALLVTGIPVGPTARADEPLVRRSTTVGQEVLVRTHQNFSEGCTPRILPRMEVIRPPEHGRLETREGVFENTGTVVGSAHCEGMKLPGILIYYVPEPGFVGVDTFTWERRVTGVPNVRFNASVTVRTTADPDRASSQAQ